jgi:hypothetical protein
MELNIKKILVIHRRNLDDMIFVETDLPNAFPKGFGYNETLSLEFHAEAGTAEDYVTKNFGRIPDEVISV